MIHTDRTLGRLLGGLILLQLGCGIASNLWLTAPLFGEGGYLALTSAEMATIRASVLFTLATACLGVLSMVMVAETLGQTATGGADPGPAVRVLGALLRNATHYLGLLASGVSLLILYAGLLALRLVPRFLANFGRFAVALQLYAIGSAVLGAEVNFALLAPLALSQLLLALWLLLRGLPAEKSAAS
ncbi:DUF4386 family protein [Pseudohaliea sp.]|uniref:DUF4386 family protein n=1 Tax=Pseudohaliea sp. TaxID=2740289 RepID=UPI0032ECFF77